MQKRETPFSRAGLVRIATLTASLIRILTWLLSEVLIDLLSAGVSVTLSESGEAPVCAYARTLETHTTPESVLDLTCC